MRYLYYCNSAYQLINILNLHWHHQHGFEGLKDYSADLMIQNSFDGADKIVERIQNKEIFHDVRLINKTVMSGRFHLLKSVMNVVFPMRYLKENYGYETKNIKNIYDAIVVPKFTPIIAAVWQVNKKAELYVHEDGAGSYFAYFDMELRSKSYRLLYKLFNSNKDFYDYHKIYINCPEFYTRDDKELVVKIPKYDPQNLEKVKEILSERTEKEDLDKDIFWFSQVLDTNKGKESFMSDDALNYLKKYKERVLYFPHPRNPVSSGEFDLPKTKQIWEIRMLNLDHIESDLLISIHSTACLTAKILYDKEPYVCLLYKIVIRHDWPYFERMDEVIRRFKESYRDPEKVFIPETIEEYCENIDRFINLSKKQA